MFLRTATLCFLLTGTAAAAGPLESTFDRATDDSALGGVHAIVATTDGGFVAAGFTEVARKQEDCVVTRLNAAGKQVWRKQLGGEKPDRCLDVTRLGDGYLAVGFTTRSQTKQDAWIVALDEDGVVRWEVVHGARWVERAHAVTVVDGQVVVVGLTSSKGAGRTDGAVIVTDDKGAVTSDWSMGTAGNDSLSAVAPVADGGLVMAGFSPQPGHPTWRSDAWVVRLDALKQVVWERRFGNKTRDRANDVVALPDGSVVVAGVLGKGDTHDKEGWLARIAPDGKTMHELRLGEAGVLEVPDITLSATGDLLVVGDAKDKGGHTDTFLARVKPTLTQAWTHMVGDVGHEMPHAIGETSTGAVVVGGWRSGFMKYNVGAWIAGWTTAAK